MTNYRKEMLDEAASIVNGARDNQYGTPEDNFAVIAEFWATYLSRSNHQKVDVTTKDVTALMILMKLAREANQHNPDNFIDTAGYAACGYEVEQRKNDRAREDRQKEDAEIEDLLEEF